MGGTAADCPMTADRIVRAMAPDAEALARRYPARGVDRDELVGEAYLALCEAAAEYVETYPGHHPFDGWMRDRIRLRLREYVRDQVFWYLAGVPVRLRRRAVRVHVATERLAARGIQRPTFEHIAQEARVDVAVVLSVAAFPKVVRRQSAVEWAEDHGHARAVGEPELVPSFGCQPGWSPSSGCDTIHREAYPKGDPRVCMSCHDTGMREHPALRRSKATDPKPEPSKAAPETKASRARDAGKAATLTRRERRRLVFGPKPEAA